MHDRDLIDVIVDGQSSRLQYNRCIAMPSKSKAAAMKYPKQHCEWIKRMMQVLRGWAARI